ncbi:MAG: hypothetical protein WCT05_10800, partial [Lentisphaeria bacterium]
MKVKQHYAAPGADDTFLRPEKDNQWAPREISVCVREDCVWMAWIHRQDGAEYPVFCCDFGAAGVTLQHLKNQFSYYSKPFFIPSLEYAIPELAVFAGLGNSCSLRIYAIRSAGQPVCSQKLSTSCTAVYHVDCLCLSDGSTYILYAGIVSGKPGIKLFLRRKISGEWLPEEFLEGLAEAYNRPKLSADGLGRVLAVAEAYQQGKYRICWRILSETVSSWQVLYEDPGWNLFPSITTDSGGRLWVSWLHLDTVRREAVAGLRHQAMLASLT